MKNKVHEEFVLQLLTDPSFSDSPTEIAKALKEEFSLESSVESIRTMVSKFKNRSIRNGSLQRSYGSKLSKYLEDNGIPFNEVSTIWHKGKRVKGENVSYSIQQRPQNKITTEDIIEAYNSLVENFDPYPTTFKALDKKEFTSDDRFALIVNPSDIHIGKLSTRYGYNSKLAVSRVREGVNTILMRADSYNVDKAIFVIGNDVLHVDSTSNTTTKGTRQDVDGMWDKMLDMALDVYADMISLVFNYVGSVHVVFCPSNHDYHSGYAIAIALKKFFENNENITFDVSANSRKYYQYGVNMFGFHHGDGAKKDKLPMLMATEEAKIWSETKYRYFYVHHVHHYTKEDLLGVTVETLRSPSEADRWHDDNGYISGKTAIEGFLHEFNTGEVNKISKLF